MRKYVLVAHPSLLALAFGFTCKAIYPVELEPGQATVCSFPTITRVPIDFAHFQIPLLALTDTANWLSVSVGYIVARLLLAFMRLSSASTPQHVETSEYQRPCPESHDRLNHQGTTATRPYSTIRTTYTTAVLYCRPSRNYLRFWHPAALAVTLGSRLVETRYALAFSLYPSPFLFAPK